MVLRDGLSLGWGLGEGLSEEGWAHVGGGWAQQCLRTEPRLSAES